MGGKITKVKKHEASLNDPLSFHGSPSLGLDSLPGGSTNEATRGHNKSAVKSERGYLWKGRG